MISPASPKFSKLSNLILISLVGIFFNLLPDTAQAAEASAINSGDTAWMLVSCALVLFMTAPGLALFYGGLVGQRNVLGTLMQSFAMTGVATVVWALWGYSLAFGSGAPEFLAPFIGGFDKLFLNGVTVDSISGSIPETTFLTFQMMFAIITPALISGAYAERMRFSAMLIFSVLWITFIYCPLAHMVWGGGWMADSEGLCEALDFAGGTVVHISSGMSALVCAFVLGKRKNWPSPDHIPHSVVLSFIGACMLWVGWFGFNAGSQLASDGNASMAFLVTHLSAAAAAIAWGAVEWLHRGKPGALGAITGAVAGLVGITPASGFVSPTSALIIGLVCGVVCYYFVAVVKNAFKYDDSLDAFGVHGVGGIIGAILTGVLASSSINSGGSGAIEGNWAQVWDQLLSVIATMIFAGVGTLVILKLTSLVVKLRVDEDEETQGLDLTQHGEEGYTLNK